MKQHNAGLQLRRASAFKLKVRNYLRNTLSRRQLQGFVGRGMPSEGLPRLILFIRRSWLSHVRRSSPLTCTEGNEILLRLPQGCLVCPTFIIRVVELNAIIFPKANGANAVRARRLSFESLVAATWASVFLRRNIHSKQAPNARIQPRRAQASNLTFRKTLENEAIEASRWNELICRTARRSHATCAI